MKHATLYTLLTFHTAPQYGSSYMQKLNTFYKKANYCVINLIFGTIIFLLKIASAGNTVSEYNSVWSTQWIEEEFLLHFRSFSSSNIKSFNAYKYTKISFIWNGNVFIVRNLLFFYITPLIYFFCFLHNLDNDNRIKMNFYINKSKEEWIYSLYVFCINTLLCKRLSQTYPSGIADK